MTIKTFLLSLCIITLSIQVNAQSEIAKEKKEKMAATAVEKIGPDVVDVAASNKDFSTLVAAIKAAGLVDALKAKSKFTVFAPTNAAFDKLDAGTVETLLKPENKEKLTKILKYHVVKGEFKAGDIANAIKSNGGTYTVETLAGGTLEAKLSGSSVILTDSNGQSINVSKADLKASNGVIHVVDAVCLPK